MQFYQLLESFSRVFLSYKGQIFIVFFADIENFIDEDEVNDSHDDEGNISLFSSLRFSDDCPRQRQPGSSEITPYDLSTLHIFSLHRLYEGQIFIVFFADIENFIDEDEVNDSHDDEGNISLFSSLRFSDDCPRQRQPGSRVFLSYKGQIFIVFFADIENFIDEDEVNDSHDNEGNISLFSSLRFSDDCPRQRQPSSRDKKVLYYPIDYKLCSPRLVIVEQVSETKFCVKELLSPPPFFQILAFYPSLSGGTENASGSDMNVFDRSRCLSNAETIRRYYMRRNHPSVPDSYGPTSKRRWRQEALVLTQNQKAGDIDRDAISDLIYEGYLCMERLYADNARLSQLDHKCFFQTKHLRRSQSSNHVAAPSNERIEEEIVANDEDLPEEDEGSIFKFTP
uniref:DUF295 domain-containing protein n=1 Tax=Ascaris lumbricoides TaxID=6252 RepID=A0A0M3IIV6_ASCLU